jgi:hypothetical protein
MRALPQGGGRGLRDLLSTKGGLFAPEPLIFVIHDRFCIHRGSALRSPGPFLFRHPFRSLTSAPLPFPSRPYLLKPFMCPDQAPVEAANFTWRERRQSDRHEFEDVEQLRSNIDFPLTAGEMESDEDLVTQALHVASCWGWRGHVGSSAAEGEGFVASAHKDATILEVAATARPASPPSECPSSHSRSCAATRPCWIRRPSPAGKGRSRITMKPRTRISSDAISSSP